MFQNIGGFEIIVILVIALLLFGNRLPDVARSLGKGITQFKRGIREATDDVKQELDASAGSEAGTLPAEPKPPQHEVPNDAEPPAAPAAPAAPAPPSPPHPAPSDASKN